MPTLSRDEFASLAARGYNRIPITREALADLETPLSLYLKLTHSAGGKSAAPYSFLLESVIGGERFGRYSFIGLPARTVIRASGFGAQARTQVITDGDIVETHAGNPVAFIEDYQKRFKAALPDNAPRFCGGLAGYFGYDTVRYIEKKLENTCPPDELGCPDIFLMHCDEVAVIDNLTGRLHFIVYADPVVPGAYEKAQEKLHALRQRLKNPTAAPPMTGCEAHQPQRGFAKADYLAAVQRAKELIAAGDFMQVEVGQRISKRFTQPPLAFYRVLRTLNPSPYLYYYDFGEFQVAGSSPEILVRCEQTPDGKKAIIRPLAGTRARGATPEDDLAAERELLADAKERAEHVMLIDLARNDIGRIARTGSVRVSEAFAIERYSHVMHIVSNVEGLLRPDVDQMDVLRAAFPAGTLSGAPKIHAMELIDELEPVKRGIYGGACGYISYAGDMDLAIAIRTAIIKDEMLHVQAAAGIVADSVPEMEWRETEHKARALLRASEMLEEGLQ